MTAGVRPLLPREQYAVLMDGLMGLCEPCRLCVVWTLSSCSASSMCMCRRQWMVGGWLMCWPSCTSCWHCEGGLQGFSQS
jgi:hypothetical protein